MPPESQAEESKFEEVGQPVAAEAKSPTEEEGKQENTTSAAQVEDSVEIDIEGGLGKPHVEDAAQSNKESPEGGEAGLGDEPNPLCGPPKDGGSQGVEEEEKKAGEQPISEVPLQDSQVESR